MVDAVNPNRLGCFVDAVEEAVGAATGTVVAGELAAERLANPAWFASEVAESEFDHRCEDSRRYLVEVTFG
ncbi:hypothetical protein L837_5174 [Mycobacterium avium MAV_061107_1842]|nr:hypothetical protein L837_5126 [Mycobacterium avium MAV_061107_1842]ETZ41219.1 hypothetical protein L837_5174 [Mycobacterium avium MAV_061107_1842]